MTARPDPTDPTVARVAIGPYLLDGPLGEGAVGRVFRAIDTRDGRAVALKTLRFPTPDAIARFKDEFRLLKDLSHDNLVQLGELLEWDGRWYFTMELVEGVDVVSYVRGLERPRDPAEDQTLDDDPADGPIDDARVRASEAGEDAPTASRLARLRAAFAQLARGLAALHGEGRVHRDVKPANVLVGRDGRVVLVDFGLVVRAARGPGADVEIVGTPRYMAPEQARGEPATPASDFYALGSMLFEVLTGQPPFLGRRAEVLAGKQTALAPRPRLLAPATPADLDQLCVDLLAFDAAARPGASQVLACLGAPSRPDAPSLDGAGFVGRERELAELRAAMTGRPGRGATVLLEGESGVGKSTLARVLGDEAAERGALVLWGRALEHESVPFKALDGAIDALVRALRHLSDDEVTPLLPVQIDLLAETFPVLRRVRAIRAAPATPRIEDPAVRRARLFDAVRELFARLAARGPVVLGIDDLQWADADSLLMLSEMLRPPVAPALTVLATRRTGSAAPGGGADDLPGGARAARGVFADAHRLTVHGLSEADSRTLVERLLRQHAGGADVRRVAQIASEAAGHPLFLDALARYAGESSNARAPLLDEALAWRVQRLNPGARRLLVTLCLTNGRVARDVSIAASDLDAERGARATAELAHARLARAASAKGAPTLEPFHDRVRQAVIARLDAGARAGAHDRLARALEASEWPDPEELMVQWLGAGEDFKAAPYARRAAERAFDALAFEAAATFYARAFALDPPRDARLAARRAEALAHAGHCEAAARAYEDASRLAGALDRLELRNRAAEQLLRGGHLDEGMARLRAVFGDRGLALPRTRLGSIVALAWERLVVALLFFALKRRAVRDASEVAPAVLARLDFAWWAGPTLGLVDPILGRLFQARHLRYALVARERTRLACAVAAYAGFSALSGWPARARSTRILARARAIAGDDGDAYVAGVLAFTTHVVAYLEGRFRDERSAGDLGECIFREQCVGKIWECDSARFFNLSAVAYTGEMNELARRRDDALAEARQRGDLYAQVHYRIGVTSMVRLAQGDPAGARAEVDDALRLWGSRAFGLQHWYGVLAACQIDLFADRPEDALARIEAAWTPMRGALLFLVEHVRVAATNLRARCRVAAAAGATGPARARLLRAAARDAKRLAREGRGWGPALGALVDARLLGLRGDAEGARAAFLTAAARCERLGIQLHAASARRRAGEATAGEDGVRMVAEADAWMTARAIVDPARMARVVCP